MDVLYVAAVISEGGNFETERCFFFATEDVLLLGQSLHHCNGRTLRVSVDAAALRGHRVAVIWFQFLLTGADEGCLLMQPVPPPVTPPGRLLLYKK